MILFLRFQPLIAINVINNIPHSQKMAVVKIKICQVIQSSFGFQSNTTVKQTHSGTACSDFFCVLFWQHYNRKSCTHFKRNDIILSYAPSAVPSKVLRLADPPGNKTSLPTVYTMDKSEARFKVQLYIYDLSRGMARNLSPIMLGEYRKNKCLCSLACGKTKW